MTWVLVLKGYISGLFTREAGVGLQRNFHGQLIFISNQTAVTLALEERAEIQYDETAQSPWFRYTAGDGAVHEVWFEDARSLAAKLGLIREYGLHGAGYWSLMRPYPQGWTLLNGLYDILDG